MRTPLGFCTLHRIAYRRDLDPTCPQCTLAGLSATQTNFDPAVRQATESTVASPVDDSGDPIDSEALDQL